MKGALNPSDDFAILIGAALILIYIWHHVAALEYLLNSSWLMVVVGAGFVAALLLFWKRFHLKLQPRLKPTRWQNMTGVEFEDQVVLWLKRSGFNQVVKTEYYDRGIDIIAAKPGMMLGVQVKRSSRPVGIAAVRAAVAGINSYGCNQAMVVTNSTFTAQAKQLAIDNGCSLVDGVSLMAKAELINQQAQQSRI
ncbi:restriction endonuclease [Patescibacteria group bacterium]|nr:restriction endonuclease [Patescibacteria group bacterium]